MSTVPEQRTPSAGVPCDREHLDQLRAPDSDVAVPANPAALLSVALLLSRRKSA